ncbi:hypothetical protein D3C78_1325910 [compost metagenome]
MEEGHFLAHRLGFVESAAQGEGLAHRQRGVGEALLAVLQAEHMVGCAGQQLVPAGEEVAVVEAVQQAAQDIQLLLQHRVGLVGIHGGAAPAFAGGVFLERGFQFVGDADVVDHQAALLVLEYPVHPRDGLHQVVALHRLVHVQGVHAGRIEAGQPHVADDH